MTTIQKRIDENKLYDIENQLYNIENPSLIKNNRDKHNEKNEKCLMCAQYFTGCVGTIIIAGIILGWIVWSIFSIIALSSKSINDYKEKCSNSNIWVLLLILVIVGNIGIFTKKKKDDESKNYIIETCFSIGLFIWSGIELYGNDCAIDKLSNSTVYILVESMFWFTGAVYLILILSIPCYIYIKNSSI